MDDDDGDFMMEEDEDFDFEYESGEEDENDEDAGNVDLENRYYSAKGIYHLSARSQVTLLLLLWTIAHMKHGYIY